MRADVWNDTMSAVVLLRGAAKTVVSHAIRTSVHAPCAFIAVAFTAFWVVEPANLFATSAAPAWPTIVWQWLDAVGQELNPWTRAVQILKAHVQEGVVALNARRKAKAALVYHSLWAISGHCTHSASCKFLPAGLCAIDSLASS